MVQRIYAIAGLRLRVIIPEQWMYTNEGALIEFRSEGGWDHTIEFEVVDQLPNPEGECVHRQPGKQVYCCGDTQLRYEGAGEDTLHGAYVCIARCGTLSRVQVKQDAIPYGITYKLVMACMEMEHLLATNSGFLLHASCIEVDGEILVVSQFTLQASTKKGNRPSYIKASKPEVAIPMYEAFCEEVGLQLGKPVQTGTFGADMKVELLNDGPVTILIDSQNKE